MLPVTVSVGCYEQCCLLCVHGKLLSFACSLRRHYLLVHLMCLQHMHGPLFVRLPAWISPLSLYSLLLVYCQEMEADELWQMELLMLYLFTSSSLLFLRNGS